MFLSDFFRPSRKPVQITQVAPPSPVQISQNYSGVDGQKSEPILTNNHQITPIHTEICFPAQVWLFPAQLEWILDHSILRIWEKSRQVGATKTDALDSVLKVSAAEARLDVWVTSRDEGQSVLYLEDALDWASLLNLVATYEGKVVLDKKKNTSAHVLQFANGRRIYCLSSNPNALAGKRGHVKIDEFALHPDQRTLFKIAQPVTTWGGTLSIMSTHRGPNSYFNQLIRDIVHNGNPMGWSHHKLTIHQAIEQGIVERINEKTGRNETREQWKARIHSQCGSEEAWNEEYCCIPSDESSAFITHDMISACEDPNLKLLTTDQLIAWLKSPEAPENPELYLGVDIGRNKDLTVFDLGLKVGNVMFDKLRLELDRKPFHVQEAELFRLLALPQLKRACIDKNGNGQEMSERAKLAFGYKVEEVHITASIKEKLAYGLRQAFESLALRLPPDPKLRADIHAMKKIVTATSNIRFDGNTDDSHCDRFMAKALRQEAARPYEEEPWSLLCN